MATHTSPIQAIERGDCMKWTEVKVETASEAVEAISNIMMELEPAGLPLKIL